LTTNIAKLLLASTFTLRSINMDAIQYRINDMIILEKLGHNIYDKI